MSRPSVSGAIALVLALAAALAASAFPHARAGDDDHVEARALLQRGEILPLSRILQVVQARVPGDVIEVELDRSSKRGWEYEVKVLTATGRVIEVDVNAHDGRIRKIEDD
ncbi:PepSY domain-containing protein [Luteimonas sp. SJ-92]|uniref:PepSY domain-containing protein n=1 Tax=Luteimonas salinisoli TaxID=2752307 RepID=A0A853JDR6_9GAMM|nr:PepSY domain-containing protein [Luteimonas salinisoli]NZA26894.1 PepSY domain-containing protein [Luteimonas salinisoli]